MKPISLPGLLGQCVLTVPVAVALGLYVSQQQQSCTRYACHELWVCFRLTQQLLRVSLSQGEGKAEGEAGSRGRSPRSKFCSEGAFY